MPIRKVCSYPGCRALIVNAARCPTHEVHGWVPDRDRGTRQERGYDKTWLKLRAMVLANEPLCRVCGTAEAMHVDHIVPLSRGGSRLDMDNLQPICVACHATKTGTEKRGGKRVSRETNNSVKAGVGS